MTAGGTHTRRRLLFAGLVATLAAVFALHAGLAARTKAPTYDETAHAFSSWLIVNHRDFRLGPEHPPLWRYVAGAALIGWPMNVDLDQGDAVALFKRESRQWHWAYQAMFQTPGNDGLALVARARLAMLVFPLALALIVGRWAWAWGGPGAGALAVGLLAFDPNLLAHAGLVTNDVAATCVFAAATYLTWQLGERFRWRTAVLLALACAAGLATKHTCLLLAPMVGIPLLCRAVDARPWTIVRREVPQRGRRLAFVVAFGVGIALLSLALLWPVYTFRRSPTSGGDHFNTLQPRRVAAYYSLEQRDLRAGITPDEQRIRGRVDTFSHGPVIALFHWLDDHHLVPEAWGFGVSYAHANSLSRESFLAGDFSTFGFRSYFPLAILVKTPVVTLLVCVVAAVVAVVRWRDIAFDPRRRWMAVCLIVPPAIYLTSAITSNLNLGIRHVLPIYPAMYVGIAVTLTSLARTVRVPRLRAALPGAIAGAAALLAVETASVFPNYISFFNLPSGGPRGGLKLLGDSNLDWGQDLNALADWYHDWRAAEPNTPFYLSYFGTVDPKVYGIDYVNAPPGTTYDPRPIETDLRDGVYAISATNLQGILSPGLRPALAEVRRWTPIAVINDTIYLYRMRPAAAAAGRTRSLPASSPSSPSDPAAGTVSAPP